MRFTFLNPMKMNWKAKYVNQDLELLLNLFKDIYQHGELSLDSKASFE